MPINIQMPALSPTMKEGNLAKWHKKEGDAVAAGDVIAEIETDKATMEVESVDDGTLGKILVSEGSENVAVNEVIAILLQDGESADDIGDGGKSSEAESEKAEPEKAEPAEDRQEEKQADKVEAPAENSDDGDIAATPLARRLAEQAGLSLSSIKGTGAHGKITRADVIAASEGKGEEPASGSPDAAPEQSDKADKGDRIFASPLARRMAEEAGLDLASITGSGPNGRIVKADIAAAQKSGTGKKSDSAPAKEDELVKMSAMRKVIAERMVQSKTNVPHFYLTVDCEIDELLKLRAAMNEKLEADGIKLSVNDFVIKAVALALMEVPDANVAWEGDGMMRRFGSADISIAVAIEGGLITPIIRNAESKSLAEISTEMKDLAEKAKGGKLTPEEYQGGSFSISNLGMFGIKQFDAIINEPQGGILAVGAGEQRPVVHDGELAIATVMSCTMSCDHRVVDGATGAVLISAIKRLIEYPPMMLL